MTYRVHRAPPKAISYHLASFAEGRAEGVSKKLVLFERAPRPGAIISFNRLRRETDEISTKYNRGQEPVEKRGNQTRWEPRATANVGHRLVFEKDTRTAEGPITLLLTPILYARESGAPVYSLCAHGRCRHSLPLPPRHEFRSPEKVFYHPTPPIFIAPKPLLNGNNNTHGTAAFSSNYADFSFVPRGRGAVGVSPRSRTSDPHGFHLWKTLSPRTPCKEAPTGHLTFHVQPISTLPARICVGEWNRWIGEGTFVDGSHRDVRATEDRGERRDGSARNPRGHCAGSVPRSLERRRRFRELVQLEKTAEKEISLLAHRGMRVSGASHRRRPVKERELVKSATFSPSSRTFSDDRHLLLGHDPLLATPLGHFTDMPFRAGRELASPLFFGPCSVFSPPRRGKFEIQAATRAAPSLRAARRWVLPGRAQWGSLPAGNLKLETLFL